MNHVPPERQSGTGLASTRSTRASGSRSRDHHTWRASGRYGRTSIAFAILILSLPALTPIAGPFGMFFGTCLAIVSLQIIRGARSIWLPGILARRLSAETVELVVGHTSPPIQRAETILRKYRPRLLTGRTAKTLLCIPVFLLAAAVALPIPFGNFLPVAALVVIAMGLMERDGLVTLFDILLEAAALGTSGGLLYVSAAALGWAIGYRRSTFQPMTATTAHTPVRRFIAPTVRIACPAPRQHTSTPPKSLEAEHGKSAKPRTSSTSPSFSCSLVQSSKDFSQLRKRRAISSTGEEWPFS